jgi:hypothetical protein
MGPAMRRRRMPHSLVWRQEAVAGAGAETARGRRERSGEVGIEWVDKLAVIGIFNPEALRYGPSGCQVIGSYYNRKLIVLRQSGEFQNKLNNTVTYNWSL